MFSASLLNYNPHQIWVGNIACMGERRGAYRILVGKPEGRRPLGRPRHR